MAEGVDGVDPNVEPLKKQEEKSDEAASSTADDDVWDDTALIRAYDRAVSMAKEEVTRRMGLDKESPSGNESNASNKGRRKKKKNNSKNVNKSSWKPGDHCRSIYSSDGVEYEATITSINLNKGTCHVTYVGYCNMEEVRLGMLKPSIGEAARKTQVAVAQTQNGVDMDYSDGPKSPREDRMDWQHPYTQAHVSDSIHGPRPRMHPMGVPPTAGMPPMAVPPPPPPHLVASYPENDGEALSAMLMSWYMSGFHTGYYQGLRQGKNSDANGQFGGNSSRKK